MSDRGQHVTEQEDQEHRLRPAKPGNNAPSKMLRVLTRLQSIEPTEILNAKIVARRALFGVGVVCSVAATWGGNAAQSLSGLNAARKRPRWASKADARCMADVLIGSRT